MADTLSPSWSLHGDPLTDPDFWAGYTDASQVAIGDPGWETPFNLRTEAYEAGYDAGLVLRYGYSPDPTLFSEGVDVVGSRIEEVAA